MNPLREFKIAVMAREVAERFVEGRAFPSDKSLNEYLKEHPNAQEDLHWVEKTEEEEGPDGKKTEKKIISDVHVPPPSKPKKIKPGKGTPPKEASTTSRVGLSAGDMSPPKELPKMKNLTKEENHIQERLLEIHKANPEKLADDFLKNIKNAKKPPKNTFETDAVKEMLPGWKQPPKPDDHPDVKAFRSRYNALFHQIANAVAKKAFVKHLDDLAKLPPDDPGRKVLVTCGGVAAGKGSALGAEPKLSAGVGATWDAAGEQNATENEWVLEQCIARGLKPTYLYVHADPKRTWQGVIDRAIGTGRMVDAQLFCDSYATGSKNVKDFYNKYKDKVEFSFGVLEKDENGKPYEDEVKDKDGNPVMEEVKDKAGNPVMEEVKDKDGKPVMDENGKPKMQKKMQKKKEKRKPKMYDKFPDEADGIDTEELYKYVSERTDELHKSGKISDDIYFGATAGRRYFQENPEEDKE